MENGLLEATEAVASSSEEIADVEVLQEHEEHYRSNLPKLRALGWDKVRAMFRAGVQDSKSQIRFLTEDAIVLFADHGRNNKLAAILSDMTGVAKDYLRRAAFISWVIDHTPLEFVNGAFVKSQVKAADMTWNDDVARAKLIAHALAVPFWSYSPEKMDIQFTADDVIKALKAVVRKFEGTRYKGDENAKQRLLDASAKIVELERIRPLAYEDLAKIRYEQIAPTTSAAA